MDHGHLSFASAIAVTARSSHEYSTTFVPQFSNGNDHFVRHDAKEHPAAHGGFVATIILSCASTHFSTTLRSQDQPDLYTAHIEFLAPTALTSASLRVEDLKLGKLTSTVRVELWQSRKGKEQLKAYGSITHMNFSLAAASSLVFPTRLSTKVREHINATRPSQISVLLPMSPTQISSSSASSTSMFPTSESSWTSITFATSTFSRTLGNIQLLLPTPQASDAPIEEWIRILDSQLPNTTHSQSSNMTPQALGYIADSWPQIVDAHIPGSPFSARGMVDAARSQPSGGPITLGESADKWVVAWYPTTCMTLEVMRGAPKGGWSWLFQRVEAIEIRGGRVGLRILMADEKGDLVATGSVSAMIVERERNARAGAREEGAESKL